MISSRRCSATFDSRERLAQLPGHARTLGQQERDIAAGGDESNTLADELDLPGKVSITADTRHLALGRRDRNYALRRRKACPSRTARSSAAQGVPARSGDVGNSVR